MNGELMRVENFLAHYASEYYDPQKAHEYYLRNRELKGKQSTKGLSDAQKEGLSYAKNQIATRQKADLKSASEAHAQAVEQLRTMAQAKREEISAKLKSMLEGISENRSKESEAVIAEQKAKSVQIREAAAQKIAALPPIPKGVSDEQRAELAAKRAQKIAEINGSAYDDLVALAVKSKKDQQALVTDTKNQQDKARTDATASKELVVAGLKAAVDKARSDYEARKEQVKADYEATAQREYDAIRGSLPGAPDKGKSKGKSNSKSKKDAKPSPSTKPGKVMSLQEGTREFLRKNGIS